MQRARYDNEGNIILEPISKPISEVNTPVFTEPSVILVETREATWTVIPEIPRIQKSPIVKQESPAITKNNDRQKRSLSEEKKVRESSMQFQATLSSAKKGSAEILSELYELPSRVKGSLRNMWKFASTPVKLPGSSRKKNPSKLTLFLTDTIRFGGTFAFIFGVLFIGVNYQSFFQIARAQLALGEDIQNEEALQNMNLGQDSGQAVRGAISNTSEQNILKYLPSVGPFEDRLVIPKLGKNIPIVRPSMDALVKEDWKQFENDIQASLHDGVVHYPGSARPGQAGNFFVTGHSSYYPWDDGKYKDVFARLHELDLGDTYFVYYGGDKHTYRVISKYEVKPTDVTVLDQPSDKRLATLMTCTPVGTTLRRLIVLSEEIDPSTGLAMHVGEKSDESSNKPFTRLEALPI